MIKARVFWPALLFMALLIFFPSSSGNILLAEGIPDELDELSLSFITMKNRENGETIMRTARIITPGDEYIDARNDLYRVESIEGNVAWADYQERVELKVIPPSEWLKETFMQVGVAGGGKQEQVAPPTIGVYHSHGDESYVPSDGTESKPEGGGVMDVGVSFVEALESHGLNVIHNEETHIPHDAGAYYRSRRTVEDLLAEGVDVLYDVHRDAVPAEEYLASSDNKEIVQIQFVVGRQNQNMEVNRSYAESLKKITDDVHPHLIKGIFMAKGNYNQDMTPLALLVEVGSHENSKEGAEESIAMFADGVSTYFVGPEGRQMQEKAGVTALRSVLWLVLIAGLILGVYLLVSTENTEELRAKINHFFKKEFAELGGNKTGEENKGEGNE